MTRCTTALLKLNQCATESFKSKPNKLRILFSFIQISIAKFPWFSCKLFLLAKSTNETNGSSQDFSYLCFSIMRIHSYLSWRCILCSWSFTFNMTAENSSKHCVLGNFQRSRLPSERKGWLESFKRMYPTW